MAKKQAKQYNWDTKITAAIRKVWRYSPERRAAILAARVDDHMVECAACHTVVHEKLAAVDHVNPCVPLSGFDGWDNFIERMKTGQMQILCDSCHKAKTKQENAQRALLRRAAKAKLR